MYAIQVTLTEASQKYNLLQLLQEVEPTLGGMCRVMFLQADKANAEGSLISVGDQSIDATRYGYQLLPGVSREYTSLGGALQASLNISSIRLRGSAAGLKLNVEVIP